jgi:8-oxo-dGTP diphosphatase
MGMSLADSGKIIPAVTCWIVADQKVLLLKRSENSKYFPGYYIGPGGNIDVDEDCVTAAIREVREETNISISKNQMTLRVVGIGRHVDKKDIFLFFVFLVNLESQPIVLGSSEGDLEWVNIDDLDNYKLLPGFKYYQKHVLSDNRAIMYTNLELRNYEIVKEANINFV